MTAMDSGVPILGEKPFTSNLDEAANLVRKQRATKVPYRIAMVYPAYSQLVKAKELLKKGIIGTIRRFYFSMQSGWMARRVENQGNTQALWRVDGKRNGVGGVLNDCGGNCQFVGQYAPFTVGDTSTGTYDGDLNEILLLAAGNKIGYSQSARTLRPQRCHFYVPTGTAGARAVNDYVLGTLSCLGKDPLENTYPVSGTA